MKAYLTTPEGSSPRVSMAPSEADLPADLIMSLFEVPSWSDITSAWGGVDLDFPSWQSWTSSMNFSLDFTYAILVSMHNFSNDTYTVTCHDHVVATKSNINDIIEIH